MKKRNVLITVLLVLTLVLSACNGGSELSKEEVLKNHEEVMAAYSDIQTSDPYKVDINMDMGRMTMDMAMGMDADKDIEAKISMTGSEALAAQSQTSEDMTLDIDMVMMNNNGTYTSYMLSPMLGGDSWIEGGEVDVEEALQMSGADATSFDTTALENAEMTYENGNYVFKGEASMDELGQNSQATQDMLPEDVTVNYVYEVDGESFLPVSVSMDGTEAMQEMMKSSMSGMETTQSDEEMAKQMKLLVNVTYDFAPEASYDIVEPENVQTFE